MQKVPSVPSPSANITLLSIMPVEEDRHVLKSLLDQEGWTVQGARSVREATKFLVSRRPQLVMCDRDLPDGTWKDVLGLASRIENGPALVVVSRHADECFWAEVLNLGGYDVVLKPFDRNEVSRVLSMALRQPRTSALEYAFI